MKERPGYYSVTPATVRYDSRLRPNEKLLYGEISALANAKGYCWAENNYFAQLYKVNKKTVSAWVNNLEKAGYIKTKLLYEHGTNQVSKRLIYINDVPMDTLSTKKWIPYPQKDGYPIHKKMEEELNTTSINTTRDNTPPSPSKSKYGDNNNVLLTEEEYEKLKERFIDHLDRINNLSYYLASTGKKYKSHYMTILSWARRDEKSKKNTFDEIFDQL